MNMISKKYVTDCEGHNEFYEKYHKEGKKRILVTYRLHSL
jgi:hypothetical protein